MSVCSCPSLALRMSNNCSWAAANAGPWLGPNRPENCDNFKNKLKRKLEQRYLLRYDVNTSEMDLSG